MGAAELVFEVADSRACSLPELLDGSAADRGERNKFDTFGKCPRFSGQVLVGHYVCFGRLLPGCSFTETHLSQGSGQPPPPARFAVWDRAYLSATPKPGCDCPDVVHTRGQPPSLAAGSHLSAGLVVSGHDCVC